MNLRLSWENSTLLSFPGVPEPSFGGQVVRVFANFCLQHFSALKGTDRPFGALAGSGERGARAAGSCLRSLDLPGPLGSLPAAAAAAAPRRFQRPLSGVPCSRGARGRPPPAGPAGLGERKGLRPGAPSPGSSRWRVRASGWGCGREEGGGAGRGGWEGGASLQPAGGRWVAVGQLKKSRRGVPQNLLELRARAEGGRRAVAAWAWERGLDSEPSPLRAASTPGRGQDRSRQRREPRTSQATGAAPGASATSWRRDRQSQVARPRCPPKHRRRSVRCASAAARSLYPSRDKLFPNPIPALGPNLSRVVAVRSRPRRACTSLARCPSAKKAEARGRARRRSEAPARSPRPRRAARAQVSAPHQGSAILLFLLLLLLLHRCLRFPLARPRPALGAPGPAPGRSPSGAVHSLHGAAPYLGAQPHLGARTSARG